MKKSLLYILLILFSAPGILYSQNIKTKDNFNVPIRDEEGDLNRDGKIDKVMVYMDTVDTTRPLKLQIFLSKPNGKLDLAVSSTKIIEPMYPLEKNGKYNGFQIPNFFIENGNLILISEIKQGMGTYEFKFQNGNFELIKISKSTNDAVISNNEKTIYTETEFNLITGLRTETDELSGSGKTLNKRKKTVLIRPLPKIQDFKFSDMYLY